jgi:hypothetical protein
MLGNPTIPWESAVIRDDFNQPPLMHTQYTGSYEGAPYVGGPTFFPPWAAAALVAAVIIIALRAVK